MTHLELLYWIQQELSTATSHWPALVALLCGAQKSHILSLSMDISSVAFAAMELLPSMPVHRRYTHPVLSPSTCSQVECYRCDQICVRIVPSSLVFVHFYRHQ